MPHENEGDRGLGDKRREDASKGNKASHQRGSEDQSDSGSSLKDEEKNSYGVEDM